jgi:hypothetical protein
VLPTLFFMGLITFERVLQSGSADVIYARGINRIRHLYLEYAPQMQPYFILSSHDESSLPIENLGVRHRARWQGFLSMAGMMAMLNSVLAGSFVGLLMATFSLPLAVTASVGGVILPFECGAASALSMAAMDAAPTPSARPVSQPTERVAAESRAPSFDQPPSHWQNTLSTEQRAKILPAS